MTLKSVLARIGDGILLGIGAGITIAIILYVQTQWAMASFEEGLPDAAEFRSYGPAAKLAVKSHRPQRAEANSAFIGQVANEGDASWNYVQISVELFDKDGQFIDKCTDHLEGTIAPDETRNFKVSCPNCANNPMPAYDSYEVAVVDATFAGSDVET